MTVSRRQFIRGIGLAVFALSTPLKVLGQLKINGIRYAMLHDERKCIGCTACMDACREVNNVPQGVSRLTIVRSGPVGEFPEAKYRFFRHSCQHCENPPCVSVCPTGASFIDVATGIVDVNADRCVGCQYCIAACPYRVRFIHPETKAADKCDFCRKTNLQQGKLPACVLACPTQALVFGALDDPHSELVKQITLSTTYRSKFNLGTEPKLYRIPAPFGEVEHD